MRTDTHSSGRQGIVIAVAGRRIDAPDSESTRFPLDRVSAVRQELRRLFIESGVNLVICSAACGADLLALEAAKNLGVNFRIVIPYGRESFRRTSVVDRPGNWGALYDEVIDASVASGNLVDLGLSEDSSDVFTRVNEAIVNEAAVAARPDLATSVLVWEGKSRGGDDATDHFRRISSAAGMPHLTVFTHVSPRPNEL